jgi:catechol 2,3-dioxygenase-like lactoylglutathione lyase family enzyme
VEPAREGLGLTTMPRIRHVLETALYVDDMARAVAFYRDVLGLTVMSEGPRLTSLDAGEATVLLLFLRGATVAGVEFPGGRIPPHDGAGPIHVGFGVDADELDAWERRLAERGVEIESRARWTRGGRSLYFRDPDGHSLELVTPGTWTTW